MEGREQGRTGGGGAQAHGARPSRAQRDRRGDPRAFGGRPSRPRGNGPPHPGRDRAPRARSLGAADSGAFGSPPGEVSQDGGLSGRNRPGTGPGGGGINEMPI